MCHFVSGDLAAMRLLRTVSSKTSKNKKKRADLSRSFVYLSTALQPFRSNFVPVGQVPDPFPRLSLSHRDAKYVYP